MREGLFWLYDRQWARLDPVLDAYQTLRTTMPKMQPEDGWWAVRFAMLFQSAHKYKNAEALYVEGLDLLRSGTATPELAFALSNLASLYLSQSRHKEAITCVREALMIACNPPVALDRRALLQINCAAIYLASGNTAAAALNLEDAAATMRDGATTPETRMAFCWTKAKLLRQLHRKREAASYIAMWKRLAESNESPDALASIDVNELRALQTHR